jgi:hypothetical protein
MFGRLPKIRRRPSGAVPAESQEQVAALGGPPAPPGPGHAIPAGGEPAGVDGPRPAGADQPTAVLPAVDPAAVDGTPVPVSPGFRDRGKLRRRLRYLRRVRELGYRDLGGLTFDLHRFGRDGTPLVHEKLAALGAVDSELRAVERALGEERAFVDLREAGIAACPRCAALHGSEARFCPSCGIALVGPMAGVVSASPAVATPPPAPPAPLWGPPGPAAASAVAPASPPPASGAAVFPGPMSPVPPEEPTRVTPAGAAPPPAAAADAAGAGHPDPPDTPAPPSHPEAEAVEPATIAGGPVAVPDPRPDRP